RWCRGHSTDSGSGDCGRRPGQSRATTGPRAGGFGMRVLFLTHRLPYPPNKGDRLRAFHIVRTLSTAVNLEVVSLAHDDEELAQADVLRQMFSARVTAVRTDTVWNHVQAAAALTGSQPLTHCLLNAADLLPILHEIARDPDRSPDVVFAYCSGMARFA